MTLRPSGYSVNYRSYRPSRENRLNNRIYRRKAFHSNPTSIQPLAKLADIYNFPLSQPLFTCYLTSLSSLPNAPPECPPLITRCPKGQKGSKDRQRMSCHNDYSPSLWYSRRNGKSLYNQTLRLLCSMNSTIGLRGLSTLASIKVGKAKTFGNTLKRTSKVS